MSEFHKPFYITTAIDYPNGAPHIGHAYEKVVTDAYARWYQLVTGNKTWFLTGLDENGQKLIQTAEKEGKEVKSFIDEQAELFKKLCEKLFISHNDFIRTTEERHKDVAKSFWEILKQKGNIYFGKYEGEYCISCESFYTKLQAPDLICPEHHKPLEHVEEEGYFFRLSNFEDWIKDYITKNEEFIVPSSARKEILSRLKAEPLRDLAISRPNQKWGIEVPEDPSYVMYTWFDALINYYSALDTDEKKMFWPADVHVIGKDIVWFHCVIWPCMLKSLEIELPKQVYVHGMVLAEDGKKMSKSLNNGVDPMEMIQKYPVDTFRYYLLRYISSGSDGRFSENDMVERHNGELANDFGNLISRTIKLALKNLPEELKGKGIKQELFFDDLKERMSQFMDKREHNKALDVLWEGMNRANQYVNNSAPWKLKEDKDALSSVIYNCLYGIHVLSLLLSPFLTESSTQALGYIGISSKDDGFPKFGEINYVMSQPEQIFPKL